MLPIRYYMIGGLRRRRKPSLFFPKKIVKFLTNSGSGLALRNIIAYLYSICQEFFQKFFKLFFLNNTWLFEIVCYNIIVRRDNKEKREAIKMIANWFFSAIISAMVTLVTVEIVWGYYMIKDYYLSHILPVKMLQKHKK